MTLFRVLLLGFSSLLFVLCFGQNSDHLASVDVHFAGHAPGFWGRYIVIDKEKRRTGWIRSLDGADVYRISGVSAAQGTRLKAILYAPACALQTLDLSMAGLRDYQYVFTCKPLPQLEIHGMLGRLQRRSDGNSEIRAKYIAIWAPAFFEYDDGTDTEIPLGGSASFDSLYLFRLSIPDLSKDKVANSADHPGEVRLAMRDPVSGRVVDQLRISPQTAGMQPTRFGGIPVSLLRTSPLVFTFCSANADVDHDEYGFGIRPDVANDGCGS